VLAKPAADTPSTEKLKLICTDPIALAAETPDGERIEFAINVGLPIALAAETPVTPTSVIINGVAVPTALAAETPVTLTFDAPVAVAVPIALAAETPVTLKVTPVPSIIVALPTALAAGTPVTSTGDGLFQAPEFQVLLSQPVIRAIRQSVSPRCLHHLQATG
tara:strand:+ start:89 stop:577 length:489 start_codon:yes stop_codon:yes gene_type:complete